MNEKKRKFWVRFMSIFLVASMVASSAYYLIATLLF